MVPTDTTPAPVDSEPCDVFLCHNSADKAEVLAIAKRLRAEGLTPWLDHERLRPGASAIQGLHAAIATVKAAAVFVGASGVGPWQAKEINAFIGQLVRRGCPVIPVMLAGCPGPPDLPLLIADHTWVDFRQLEPEPIAQLYWGITGNQLVPPPRHQSGKRTAAPAGWDWIPGESMVLPPIGMSFKWIPSGTFTMGSADDDPEAFDRERPAHQVTITEGYWLGEHPVTNAQYLQFAEAAGHRAPTFWGGRRFNDPAQPVVGVSWDDAQAFCAWVNGQAPAGSELRFRLPTEAEWEYAARGTDGRRYPWGNEPPDATRATFGLDVNTGAPSKVGGHPAGVSPFGVHDLAGNVWEWCADWYAQYDEAQSVDPVGPPAGSYRVVRGGSWFDDAGRVRAAARFGDVSGDRDPNGGFRLARVPAPSKPGR